jgi:hypothetical protein
MTDVQKKQSVLLMLSRRNIDGKAGLWTFAVGTTLSRGAVKAVIPDALGYHLCGV